MMEALPNPNVESSNVMIERDLRLSPASTPAERCQYARTCINVVIGPLANQPGTVGGFRGRKESESSQCVTELISLRRQISQR